MIKCFQTIFGSGYLKVTSVLCLPNVCARPIILCVRFKAYSVSTKAGCPCFTHSHTDLHKDA